MKEKILEFLLFFGGVIGVILILSILLQSCTPVRYVYVDQKDSVVRKQRIIYDNLYVPSPFFYNSGLSVPYRPIVIQRYSPIVVPQRPTIPHNRWSTPQRPFSTRPYRQKH